MYNFHYNHKPKYDNKLNLPYTDRDSVIYEIETAGFYTDMSSDDLSKHFDTSDYPEDYTSYCIKNKKVLPNLQIR